MKVLHVVNISFVLPYYIGEQFDFFSNRGVKYYVACQNSSHFQLYSEQKKFIPYGINILREISFLEDMKAVYLLTKYIRAEKIDLVVSHTPKGGLIGTIAAYLAGIENRVYFRHGLMFETSKGFKRKILMAVERFTGFLATKVVCVSPSVLNISNNERLSNPGKNLLLNKGTCNGIDIDRFDNKRISESLIKELRSKFSITEDMRVLGFVGRLVNDKGIYELISAWQLLLKTEEKIMLLLVGPFEERDSISEELKNYIVNTPSIVHTGLTNDITPFYCLMDIFILPSYREGFPTVVLEASSMELPVLTTRSTGCRDSIVENETGLFIDLEPFDIAKKIKTYLEDPELAYRHGKKGRNFVEENFEQRKIWDEIGIKILGL